MVERREGIIKTCRRLQPLHHLLLSQISPYHPSVSLRPDVQPPRGNRPTFSTLLHRKCRRSAESGVVSIAVQRLPTSSSRTLNLAGSRVPFLSFPARFSFSLFFFFYISEPPPFTCKFLADSRERYTSRLPTWVFDHFARISSIMFKSYPCAMMIMGSVSEKYTREISFKL